MTKSNTPTLDKHNLHAFGGSCTCYSDPYGVCRTCKRAAEYRQRWNALSASDQKKAQKEIEYLRMWESDDRPGCGGR